MNIGASKFGGGFVKKQWENLKPGDNYFRVLPPVHSLAADGKYAVFHSHHSGFKNSEGRARAFACLEKKDNKSKMITQRCPVCDNLTVLKGHHEQLKATNPDMAKKFWDEQIFPFNVQKNFYLNALNQAGEFVVLAIPYKCFKSLDALLAKTMQEMHVDATGLKGMYLKFVKTQAFKGDRDTSYHVELAMKKDGFNLTYMLHELTEALLNEMPKRTADLSLLYKNLAPEQVAQLAALPAGPDRAKLVDAYFASAEKTNEDEASSINTSIPGTNLTAVTRIEATPTGPEFVSPVFNPNTIGASAQPVPQQFTGVVQGVQGVPSTQPVQTAPSVAPAAPAVPAAPAPTVQSAPVAPVSPAGSPVTGISPEDFTKYFGSR